MRLLHLQKKKARLLLKENRKSRKSKNAESQKKSIPELLLLEKPQLQEIEAIRYFFE